MVKEASHRAKIFVITVLAYVLCWFPLFLLILIDIYFKVSPKVYQAFSFIAWSQGTVEPLIYICFDRQLNLLARWVYCDRYKRYDTSTLAYLMQQNKGPVHRAAAGLPTTTTTTTAAAASHNSVGYRDGGAAAAYPYHHNDDVDVDDDYGLSEESTGHPSPPLPPQKAASSPSATATTAMGFRAEEPTYGNQRLLKGGQLAGSQHEVTASLEVTVPSEVQC